jgi:hypothetical protein
MAGTDDPIGRSSFPVAHVARGAGDPSFALGRGEMHGIRLRSTGVRDRKIENLKLNGWSIWRSSEDVYSSLAVGL